MDYIYAEINQKAEKLVYKGVNTPTADTTVNNVTGTISVQAHIDYYPVYEYLNNRISQLNHFDNPETDITGAKKVVTSVSESHGIISETKSFLDFNDIKGEIYASRVYTGEPEGDSYLPETISDVYEKLSHTDSKIDDLNFNLTASPSQTITYIAQDKGQLEAVKQNIQITKSQVTGLNKDLSDVTSLISGVQSELDDEEDLRFAADTALSERIDAVNQALTTETSNRQSEDQLLRTAIETEASTRQQSDTILTTQITQINNRLTNKPNISFDNLINHQLIINYT